jgi:GT2 family glycosyltransferase
MSIGFVVLHYQTIDDTKACIKSIVDKIDTDDYIITIVDNGSPNKTGSLLQNEFAGEKKIKVIINDKNLGFAKGLNSGIEYLRKLRDFDFIALVNNDTEIIGNNWYSKIVEKYNEYKFHILGPDIISLDGENHSNPVERQLNNIEDLNKLIKYKKRMLLSNYLFIDSTIRFIKEYIKKTINYKSRIQKKIPHDVIDVQLQGSCFILSKLFFEKRNGLYSNTFLYFEEAILRYFADVDNMKMMYTPDIVILHKEGGSTNYDYKNIRSRRIFYLKHSLNSCLELKKIMDDASY